MINRVISIVFESFEACLLNPFGYTCFPQLAFENGSAEDRSSAEKVPPKNPQKFNEKNRFFSNHLVIFKLDFLLFRAIFDVQDLPQLIFKLIT